MGIIIFYCITHSRFCLLFFIIILLFFLNIALFSVSIQRFSLNIRKYFVFGSKEFEISYGILPPGYVIISFSKNKFFIYGGIYHGTESNRHHDNEQRQHCKN